MGDTSNETQADKTADTKPALTKEEAAKLVKREVPILDKDKVPVLDKNKKPKTEKVAIEAAEVFDFNVRDDGTLVVVTVDGQKLFGEVK